VVYSEGPYNLPVNRSHHRPPDSMGNLLGPRRACTGLDAPLRVTGRALCMDRHAGRHRLVRLVGRIPIPSR
jgi:hypothetical protein